jgi:hypothetical protein
MLRIDPGGERQYSEQQAEGREVERGHGDGEEAEAPLSFPRTPRSQSSRRVRHRAHARRGEALHVGDDAGRFARHVR